MSLVTSVSANPLSTAFVLIFILLWAVAGPAMHFSDTWQLIINTTSSVITLAMVFILNHAQLKDTKAINTKLDELIRAAERADNAIIGLEERPFSESVAAAEAIREAVAGETQLQVPTIFIEGNA